MAALWLCLPGCDRNRLNPTAGRVTATDANLASLRKVEGRWRSGAGDAAYTAYFHQSDLHLIEEQPESAAWRHRYYFREGQLFHYRRLAGSAPSSADRQFFLDKKGKLNPVQKNFDITEGEIAPIARHAEELKHAATARAGTVITLPLLRNRAPGQLIE
jgi:hypothetical protein